MMFSLESCFLHSPRPLGLRALKLRLALIATYEALRQGEREPVDDRPPIGCRVPSIDLRRLIGLGKARDARALRSAVDELIGDPAIRYAVVTPDGRHVEFALVDELCDFAHRDRYAMLEIADITMPRTVVGFHLWMRYVEARRMNAPSAMVVDDYAMAMADPGRPDRAWARRTLLPAARRLAARIGGPVFVGGTWPADPTMPPTLRFRFGGPATRWRPKPFSKARPNESAWLVTAASITCLQKSRIEAIYA